MLVKVFFDENVKPDTEKAIIATSLCQAAGLYIKLPDYIEVHFSLLEENIYGITSLKNSINRTIIINYSVPTEQIIHPITHELIHLNQMYEGKLSVTKSGMYIWMGSVYSLDTLIFDFNGYASLPWEQDVVDRQPKLIGQIVG